MFDDTLCINCGHRLSDMQISQCADFCTRKCEHDYYERCREDAEYRQLFGEPEDTPCVERGPRPSEY